MKRSILISIIGYIVLLSLVGILFIPSLIFKLSEVHPIYIYDSLKQKTKPTSNLLIKTDGMIELTNEFSYKMEDDVLLIFKNEEAIKEIKCNGLIYINNNGTYIQKAYDGFIYIEYDDNSYHIYHFDQEFSPINDKTFEKPHGSIISYFASDDLEVYTFSKEEGMKESNLITVSLDNLEIISENKTKFKYFENYATEIVCSMDAQSGKIYEFKMENQNSGLCLFNEDGTEPVTDVLSTYEDNGSIYSIRRDNGAPYDNLTRRYYRKEFKSLEYLKDTKKSILLFSYSKRKAIFDNVYESKDKIYFTISKKAGKPIAIGYFDKMTSETKYERVREKETEIIFSNDKLFIKYKNKNYTL